jgi:hypothetical protein
MPRLVNFIRGGGTIIARGGRGEGSIIVAQRIEKLPAHSGRLVEALVACDGIAAVQIGATDEARTSVPTAEKGMRKNEGFFVGLLIIEALNETSLDHAWRKATEIAPNLFDGVSGREIYRSIFALDARIADFA